MQATNQVLVDWKAFVTLNLSYNWEQSWLRVHESDRPVESFKPGDVVATFLDDWVGHAFWPPVRGGPAVAASVDADQPSDIPDRGSDLELDSSSPPTSGSASEPDADQAEGSGSAEEPHNLCTYV